MNKIYDMNDELIFKKMFEYELIKIGRYKLKSGKISNFYIDFGDLPSYPILFNQIIFKMIIKLPFQSLDKLCGVAMRGIPIAVAIGSQISIPVCYTRPNIKKHGIKKFVEGKIKAFDKIGLVDDVITNSDSKFEAIELIDKQEKVEVPIISTEVKDIFVIVDREEGAEDFLKGLGIRLHSLYKISKILEYGSELIKVKSKE